MCKNYKKITTIANSLVENIHTFFFQIIFLVVVKKSFMYSIFRSQLL